MLSWCRQGPDVLCCLRCQGRRIALSKANRLDNQLSLIKACNTLMQDLSLKPYGYTDEIKTTLTYLKELEVDFPSASKVRLLAVYVKGLIQGLCEPAAPAELVTNLIACLAPSDTVKDDQETQQSTAEEEFFDVMHPKLCRCDGDPDFKLRMSAQLFAEEVLGVRVCVVAKSRRDRVYMCVRCGHGCGSGLMALLVVVRGVVWRSVCDQCDLSYRHANAAARLQLLGAWITNHERCWCPSLRWKIRHQEGCSPQRAHMSGTSRMP